MDGLFRALKALLLRIPPFAVFLMTLLLTAMATMVALEKSRAKQQTRLDLLSRRTTQAIESRMEAYLNTLYSVRSFFAASERVTRDEFRQYIDGMELETRYPGIRSISFAVRVEHGKLDHHLREIRGSGFPTYEVWPASSRPEAFPTVFIEPFNPINQRSFGFDNTSEPRRQAAVEQAIQSGGPAMTSKVTLNQESSAAWPGFSLYMPIFRKGQPVATPQQRREALMGVLSAAFRAEDLFGEILKETLGEAELASYEVFDGKAPSSDGLLYSVKPALTANTPTTAITTHLTIAQHPWTVVLAGPAVSMNPLWDPMARTALILGLAISFLIYLYARVAIQANTSLAKSERQIKLITDSLPMLISYIDQDDRYRFVNKAYQDWYGLDLDAVNGKSAAKIHGPETYSWYRPLAQRVFAGETLTFERILNHRQLGKRLAQIHYIPDRRPDGTIPGLVVLVTDITEQRQVAEKLDEARRTAELVSEVGLSLRGELEMDKLCQRITDVALELIHASIGICYLKEGGHESEIYALVSVSGSPPQLPLPRRSALRELGYLQTALLSPTIIRHGDVSRLAAFTENRPSFARPGTIPWRSYIAAPLISRSGEIMGALYFASEIPDVFDDRAEKLLMGLAAQAAVAIDNAKLYSEAQAINRIKDEFLATLSHELRTPLNVILGHAELLQSDPNLGESSASVTAILRNAKILHQLIADLLDISAVITGKISIRPAKMDACAAARAALETVRFAAEIKGVNLTYSQEAQHCLIVGDATRIQQIVWNLLTNAVKFTAKGGHIGLGIRDEKSKILIEVRDDGIGIEPEFLPYVFDRFRQEDSSFTRRFGGLGLGLNIARQLAELHGGSIDVASAGKGKGATFTVRLPIAPVNISPGLPPAVSPSPPKRTLQGADLLIVDDENDGRNLLSSVLQRAGARVRTAASADEAMSLYRNHQPELILCDIGMPEKDGLAFMRELRALEAERGDFTPAIALTAYARDEDRRRALAAGYQVHLPKPVESHELLEAIQKAIEAAGTVP